MKSASVLAIDGGTPVRATLLPYARQHMDDSDIEAVVQVLRSDWLTTGPAVPAFEQAFGAAVGAKDAVAVSSGTAALHTAAYCLDLGPNDEVIVPAMTFAATATGFLMQGAKPVVVDVNPETLLIDCDAIRCAITPRTKAVVCVDYAGQPCGYRELMSLCSEHKLPLIADSCHALGATYGAKATGSLADITCFSFHPVKHIATGEGGMLTTDRTEFAERARRFRNHGISRDHRERKDADTWTYEIVELGMNYRLSDILCALGQSQLTRLPSFLKRRREIAAQYDRALESLPGIQPLARARDIEHAYHLYVVRVTGDRAWIFRAMRAEGIAVNVHYPPIHHHPLVKASGDIRPCPNAEAAYEQILSLPLFPTMTDDDQRDVLRALERVLHAKR